MPESAALQTMPVLKRLLNVYCQSYMDCDSEVLLPWDPLVHWAKEVSSTKKILTSEMTWLCKIPKKDNHDDLDLQKYDLRRLHLEGMFHYRAFCFDISKQYPLLLLNPTRRSGNGYFIYQEKRVFSLHTFI